ncbi:MAG TPA: PEP-CTERM sorting domain-containing protein [Fimbriimonadaceae bacterium]|nr:PEP-CTERM sorting domain-containing protein [Fimbriimonadaceae bacterium]
MSFVIRNISRVLPLAGVTFLLPFTASAFSYSTGFEAPEFSLGPMSNGIVTQGGWSGGAQTYFQNSDAGDEQISTAAARTGSQGWHYARGYNSPGQGTPYTPNVNPALNQGDMFSASIWFKAASAADGSSVAIETGNVAGDDRADIIAYIENISGGLTIRSFTGSSFASVALSSGLDGNAWHNLSFTLTRDGVADSIAVSVNGGAATTFAGSLNSWRNANNLGYAETSRLKFRARHADGDPQFNGFYFDDISYSTSPVPEPGTMAVLGLGALGLLRRRNNARKAASKA